MAYDAGPVPDVLRRAGKGRTFYVMCFASERIPQQFKANAGHPEVAEFKFSFDGLMHHLQLPHVPLVTSDDALFFDATPREDGDIEKATREALATLSGQGNAPKAWMSHPVGRLLIVKSLAYLRDGVRSAQDVVDYEKERVVCCGMGIDRTPMALITDIAADCLLVSGPEYRAQPGLMVKKTAIQAKRLMNQVLENRTVVTSADADMVLEGPAVMLKMNAIGARWLPFHKALFQQAGVDFQFSDNDLHTPMIKKAIEAATLREPDRMGDIYMRLNALPPEPVDPRDATTPECYRRHMTLPSGRRVWKPVHGG